MTTTVTTAQSSRSGEGVSRQVNALKTMLNSYVAAQKTLNEEQTKDIEKLGEEIGKMNTCSAQGMIYAPTSPNRDSDDCLRPSSGNITQGRIQRPVEYTSYSGSVTFDTPYASPPTVTYSIMGYVGSGSCRGYNVDLRMTIENVTTTGFDYTMNGYNSGCGRLSIYDALWFASEDPISVTGPLACAPTRYSGADFPSRTAGSTHSENVGRTSLSCPARDNLTAYYQGDVITGTCIASADGTSASWGSFRRTARCSYQSYR